MNATHHAIHDDDESRELVRSKLDDNLYVEAGAGTGKTSALVARLIELLVTRGVNPEEIAAITFTRAAAFEMRSRLRAALEEIDTSTLGAEQQGRIASVIDSLDLVAIQTIHAFALSMLRERPLDIGLPPVIESLDDVQAAVEFENSWSEWFAGQIESDESLVRSLTVAQRLGLRNPADLLRQLAQGLEERHSLLRPGMFERADPRESKVDVSVLTETLDEATALVQSAPVPEDKMCLYVNETVAPAIRSMLSLAGEATELPASDFADWQAIKPGRVGAQKNWKAPDGSDLGLLRLREILFDLQDQIDAAVEPLKRATLATLLSTAAKFAIERSADRRRQGRLTFFDQLLLARELLSTSSAARDRFQCRFRFILVDEFQDTDPVQIDLLKLLTENADGEPRPGSLFVVGDPKQSIYRFRGADPISSREFSDRVATSGIAVPLSENHRSLPGIVRWVNTVFSSWLKEGEEQGQAPARDLRWEPQLDSDDRVERLDSVRWFGGERDASTDDTRWLEFEEISEIAAAAGAGAFKVRDNDGEWRDSTYSDAVVLVARRTGLEALEELLVEKGVPYVIDGQAALFTSQDIRDLHACLTAIDDPADQVAVLSAIRSPAFSCPDTDLLLWKNSGGGFSYLDDDQSPALSEPTSVADAYAELRRFHGLSRELSTADLVERFIRDRRLREKAMLTRRGPERAHRLDLVIELANVLSDPDSGSGISLRDFTRWIARQTQENTTMPEKLSESSTSDAVRVMTIHRAKGLEFPIVIMASANTRQGNPNSVQLRTTRSEGGEEQIEVQLGGNDLDLKTDGADDALEQEKADDELESVRLLYVAATRARDHLFVSRYRSTSGRAKPLIRHIERHMEGNERLWSQWSYLGRADRQITPRPELAGSAVERDRFVDERTALIASASRTRYTTPTALKPASEQDAPQPKQTSRRLGDESPKPGRAASERGRAVHAVLQHTNLSAWTDPELATVAERMAADHAADPEQVLALAKAALNTLTMQSASAAAQREQAWREVSVAVPLPGGVGELEGQIDLLFMDENGDITIVDHKTDADRGDSLEQAARPYFSQMGAYALAVEQVTGRRVSKAVLLFASRALSASPCEYEVPDLPAEMERASRLAVEQVSMATGAV